ncbi:MAG: hypothetical protein JXR49_13965 [Acidobacteria bacterium]|nr:hypothetical protein [Acidobacteriota bacterium]
MKHAAGWVLAAFFFSLLLPVASKAQTEDTLFLVAAKESRVKAQAWIDFLQRYDLPVEHYVLSELDLVKNHDFIAIVGGLDETGFRDLLKGVLGEAEIASLEAEGAKKMFVKDDVWKPGQKVLVFAGSDPAEAAEARSDSRETWMEYLTEWFDLEEIPGGLKAY